MKNLILVIALPIFISGCFEQEDRNTLLSVEKEVNELRELVECYESNKPNCSSNTKVDIEAKSKANNSYIKFPAFNQSMSYEQKMQLKIHRDGEEIVRRLVSAEIKKPRDIRIGRPSIAGDQVRYSAFFHSEDSHSRLDVDLDFATEVPTIRKMIVFRDDQSFNVVEQPKYKLVLISKE